MAGQKFAVFDIDGTLIRWQLYHALTEELARQGYVDKAEFQKVRAARMDWKKRSGTDSYVEYEKLMVDIFESALKLISPAVLVGACHNVMEEYQDQVYTYTRDLICELKTKKYLIFAISSSQIEIVKMMAEYYGFDDFGGTVYKTSDNHYTGEKEALRYQSKADFLDDLVKKHGAVWQNSIGVGDSESDIAMLSKVEKAIAFNPTRKLFDEAKRKNWKVVVERKNMVYELESNDGSYLLA